MDIKNYESLNLDELKNQVKTCLMIGGGFGFLGKNLVHALLQLDCKVRVLSHIPIEGINPEIEIFLCDITNPESVVEACRGVDTVFHVASIINTSMILRESTKELMYAVNVLGAENVIAACKQCNVHRLIYTSSNNVVFDKKIINGNETLPYAKDVHERYTETKMIAEQKIIAANCETLSTCSLRPGGIYGPGDRLIFRRLIEALKSGSLFATFGDKDALGDSVYIDNLIYAHLLAAMKLKKGSPVAGQVYFISDDHPSNYFEFMRPLIEGLGYRYPQYTIPYPIIYSFAFFCEVYAWLFNAQEPLITRMEVKKISISNYFSIEKAKKELAYFPLVSQEQGLKNSLAYCKILYDTIDAVKRPHIFWWVCCLGGMSLLGLVAYNHKAYAFFSKHFISFLPMYSLKILFLLAAFTHICEALYAYNLAHQKKLRTTIGWFFQTLLLGYPSLGLLKKVKKRTS